MKITLAIHTYRHAIRLKHALERAGIEAWLQDLNTGAEAVDESKVYSGIRVRIEESDLPTALHLIESGNIYAGDEDSGRIILVPVDFSRRGFHACLIAARLALRSGMKMVLLHACPTPYFEGQMPESDFDDGISIDNGAELEIEEVKAAKMIQNNANVEMKRFRKQMKQYCSDNGLNNLPEIASVIEEGVPEEVIAQYYKDHSVALVVMSTRDTNTRANQAIGSVTAEVIDNARISVLTIPDVDFDRKSLFKHVLMFCNLDQEDLLLVDYVVRLSSEVEGCMVTLVPVNERAKDVADRTQRLAQILTERYPDRKFDFLLSPSVNHADLKTIIKQQEITLVALANKRRNILARIFNPGLAHKVLFTNDVPLFALSNDESI